MQNLANKKQWTPRSLLYSPKIAPYVFTLPFILSFVVLFCYPMFTTVTMSMQNVENGFEWVGMKNYKVLLNSSVFYTALKNSIVYTILTLGVLIPLPMALAALLDNKRVIGKNVFRSILFVPSLTSVVVAGIIFRLILGDLPTALFNRVVVSLGFEPRRWLTEGNQTIAYTALVVMCTWRWLGVNMLYFLSGLESIPNQLYESAAIDGATGLKQFFYISVPLLRPITIYVTTISIYGGMSMFAESLMLFGSNNSPRNVGLTLVGLLYRNGFEQAKMGRGAAIGLMLMAFTLVVSLLFLGSTGQFSKEERD